METRTKIIFAVSLAAALCYGGLTTTSIYAASTGPGRFGGRFGGLRARVAERLGLSDQQRAEIRAVLVPEKDAITDLAARLHAARQDLREAIRAGGASEASVRAAAAKVAAVESDIAVERAKLYKQLSPVLTNEQRAQLDQIQARLDDFVSDAISRIGERLAQ